MALRQVLADPARYVNVALFLRAVARISAVVLVAVVALDIFDTRWEAVLIAVSVMVVVDYVVVGVAPRTLGRQHAARIALVGCPGRLPAGHRPGTADQTAHSHWQCVDPRQRFPGRTVRQ